MLSSYRSGRQKGQQVGATGVALATATSTAPAVDEDEPR
jgi:hypothetical protein